MAHFSKRMSPGQGVSWVVTSPIRNIQTCKLHTVTAGSTSGPQEWGFLITHGHCFTPFGRGMIPVSMLVHITQNSQLTLVLVKGYNFLIRTIYTANHCPLVHGRITRSAMSISVITGGALIWGLPELFLSHRYLATQFAIRIRGPTQKAAYWTAPVTNLRPSILTKAQGLIERLDTLETSDHSLLYEKFEHRTMKVSNETILTRMRL